MDDDLFSTILYLVPVAAVLFFRVFAGNRRSQAAKNRGVTEEAARQALQRRLQQRDLETSGRAAPLSRISGREPESQDWEPHWVTTEESADYEAPEEEGPEDSERLVTPETQSVPSSAGFSSFAPSLAGEANPSPTPGEAGVARFRDFPLTGAGPSLLSPADLSGARDTAAARAAPGPFPGSIERLPPLKKALVLSELLGKPKALEGWDGRK